ncbi:MAG: hypothetical protein A2W86_04805 [Bacteroidetes bacterium GWD2_45_23]|nr:MAG: hypothetical protein A2W87_12035 [Bacteroidetes bacterium GWC2_46_850]OFX79090.1 MAG: hypothetical protein A2071_06025 [Bacteroidetes bacterium GWC1_47_7]OFX87507.1 MAG: hypothetical protein A2W86_04805 [Bacteroidetes bacterium GWD2_45_23]HBB01554.1 DUF58 domain-containing protein [Porphyromonadaceae bacterium]HCC18997.1 DUF58 domain-containing protein [Porphyromonadaceae bacterium]
METTDLLKKVRHIEIKARGLSRNIFAGEYHSAFKGRGMAFSEVREYQYGDDLRDIDWNVTARYNRPYVKIFEEERELTVMLMIDVSESLGFGSRKVLKRDMVAEIAATLAFSAIQNNDKIGVIFFTDKVEKFIPPKKGKKHILFIIREILGFTPGNSGTDMNMALRYMTNAIKKRCTAFLISDFIDPDDYKKALQIANRKHDVVAIQVYDQLSTELLPVGLMKVRDPETGEERWINTSSRRVRENYQNWWKSLQRNMHYAFRQSGVDSISVSTESDYVKALLQLFQQRK